MGYEKDLLALSQKAITSLASAQYYAVKPSGVDGCDLSSVAGDPILGLGRNDPAINQQQSVGMLGIYLGKLGGTVSLMDQLTNDSAGKLVRARPGDWIIGYALQTGVTGDVIAVFVSPQYPADMYFTTSDDCSAKVGYAVAAHTVAGQSVLAASTGVNAIGILLANAAAGVAVKVRTFGVCQAVAGTSGVAVGALLMTEAGGKVITATGAGKHVCGIALAAINADATGTIFFGPRGTLDS